MKKIIIAIDGPAGSGKTSSAKIIADKLGYIYIDTGAMYRAVTLAVLRSGIEPNETNVCKMMENIEIRLEPSDGGQRTILNGEDVSDDIRLPEVTKLVSPVSAMACVRELMVAQQRELGKHGAVVMDGRDIGTVVFPQAELKVYLIATIEARAMRRTKELEAKGMLVDVKEIEQQILARDEYDSTRENSPLKKADDAIAIDTSLLTLKDQSDMIYNMAMEVIKKG